MCPFKLVECFLTYICKDDFVVLFKIFELLSQSGEVLLELIAKLADRSPNQDQIQSPDNAIPDGRKLLFEFENGNDPDEIPDQEFGRGKEGQVSNPTESQLNFHIILHELYEGIS